MVNTFFSLRMLQVVVCCALLISCNAGNGKRNKGKDYFKVISVNDIKLPVPKPGEWRARHVEENQSFDRYCKQGQLQARDDFHKIYLLQIGTFNNTQQQCLKDIQVYLSLFFQLPTENLPSVSEALIPDSAKRKTGANNVQLLTTFIIDTILVQTKPVDGYALLGLTSKDLYPGKNWNYVFGMASYANRVGVSSFYRYNCNAEEPRSYQTCLRRIIATASHEIGHMFSIKHCLSAVCVMNGSNSLAESDLMPLRLCSVCQQKLQWNLRYKNLVRLKQLKEFLQKKGLASDAHDLHKDLEVVGPTAND
ncbi:archaemetzincin [Flavihumibacter sp. CACIAM 22H1]|uniref:archaemetzincin n=1 Tax=Flavihumibacter sp. CACIAM 22H1 TaxID=1812911 RepID=UPI0007A81428|nr:archaemetzincin [Flavihumibacter sp. CACIAM 22H1]KYP13362.1 MAG: hypothetical protein A1D16_20620 [Flavihumibacter sp. CACIAM 22H1]